VVTAVSATRRTLPDVSGGLIELVGGEPFRTGLSRHPCHNLLGGALGRFKAFGGCLSCAAPGRCRGFAGPLML
jgi:hypothetical protein